jgi:hypothetical protein
LTAGICFSSLQHAMSMVNCGVDGGGEHNGHVDR